MSKLNESSKEVKMRPVLRSVTSSQAKNSLGEKCTTCSHSIQNKNAIVCDNCRGVYDPKCAKLTTHTFDELVKMQKSSPKAKVINWYCSTCAKTEPGASNKDVLSGFENIFESKISEFMESLEKKVDVLFQRKIESFIGGLTAKVDLLETKINDLQIEIGVLRNKSIQDQNAASNDKFIQLQSKIQEVENGLNNQIKNVQTIDQRNTERRDRQKNLLIYGVPDGERNLLGGIVKQICVKYDANFNAENVSYFRLYTKDKNSAAPPILCKFNSKAERDAIFFNYIKTRNLYLADVIEGAGVNERVFINEHLSKEDANIVRECNKLKREGKLIKFYLRDGNIYVSNNQEAKKKNQGTQIKSSEELQFFIANATTGTTN